MLRRFNVFYWTGRNAKIDFFALATGLSWTIVFTLFLGIVLGAWISVSSQANFYLSNILWTCLLAGVMVGGLKSGMQACKYGWIHGGIVGLFYVLLILIILGFGVPVIFLEFSFWFRILFLILASIFSGVLGVNFSVKKRLSVRHFRKDNSAKTRSDSITF